MIKILFAKPVDCDSIIQLQRLAYESEAKLYQDWTIPPLTQTSKSLQQDFPNFIILKAVQAGKIIGSVRAQQMDSVCHIGRLIVHPNFQRQGIGSDLLQRIEQRFAHASRYELFTGSKSEANIRLYLRHGYEISHTMDLSENITLIYLTKLN